VKWPQLTIETVTLQSSSLWQSARRGSALPETVMQLASTHAARIANNPADPTRVPVIFVS
jgi:hypothetical protein